MDYILLGRSLDKESRENGYPNCPDDIIQLILNYTGDIRQTGTGFFLIQPNYSYDSYFVDYKNNRKMTICKRKPRRTTYTDPYYFCSVCNRRYVGKGKGHMKTDKHIRNLGLNVYHDLPDLDVEVLVKNSGQYRQNLSINKDKLYIREMWDYRK